MHDNRTVDSVGQLAEGQTLVYILWDRGNNIFVAGPEAPRGVLTCILMRKASRFASGDEARQVRDRMAQPHRWAVVPAVYDAVDDKVIPVGG